MSSAPETLEQELVGDLMALGDRFTDEEFCSELYRALARNAWRKETGPEGRLALSFTRAEQLVNELRARRGYEPLALAQTGGEGEISGLVAGELERLGWHGDAVDASTHDPERLTHPASPPPRDQGERQAPADPSDWERRAHEEADAALREHPRAGSRRETD